MIRRTPILVLLTLSLMPMSALADNFSVGVFSQSDIGNNFNGENTSFDILDLFANNGSVSLIEGTTVTAFLSQVEWAVGNTGAGSAGLYTGFTASRSLTLDGVTKTLSQGFQDNVGNTFDTVTLSAGPTVTFDLGAEGMVDVTLLGASFTGSSTAATFGGINANFLLHDVPAPAPVPEPAAILLLATLAVPILVRPRFSR